MRKRDNTNEAKLTNAVKQADLPTESLFGKGEDLTVLQAHTNAEDLSITLLARCASKPESCLSKQSVVL
jgi:hypothetical protein